MAFWHWKEVYCGRDEKAYDRVLKILKQADIPIKRRLVGGHNILGVHSGKGTNIQYYIYVQRENAEMASFLLRRQ